MKKLLFVLIFSICGLLNSVSAQLPGNPLNPHGTVIDKPGIALAKWERSGNNLYWEFTITTPNVFYLPDLGGSFPAESYIEFVGYNTNGTNPADPGPARILFPGSMSIVFDEVSFPYGYKYYSGVIDLSNYDHYWATVQADFLFYTDDTGSEEWDSMIITDEELYPENY